MPSAQTVSGSNTGSANTDSPCIGICALDQTGTYCTGCLRTRAEIGRWSVADDTEKREILARVEKRKRSGG